MEEATDDGPTRVEWYRVPRGVHRSDMLGSGSLLKFERVPRSRVASRSLECAERGSSLGIWGCSIDDAKCGDGFVSARDAEARHSWSGNHSIAASLAPHPR
jgi:hypothetical protein